MKSLFFFLFLILFSSPFCNFDKTQNLVWIEVASAERQCITPTYSSLEDALNQLTSNNIEVFDQKEISFIVCAACSCPTGIVYQAQINDSDADKAENLGWGEANNFEE
jgi:hypothetical protein